MSRERSGTRMMRKKTMKEKKEDKDEEGEEVK